MAKSIILIGPPGSGKSTIGRAISRKLKISFTDTDQLIEVRAGMSISQIFIDKGEPWFRDLEKEVLKEELHEAMERRAKMLRKICAQSETFPSNSKVIFQMK